MEYMHVTFDSTEKHVLVFNDLPLCRRCSRVDNVSVQVTALRVVSFIAAIGFETWRGGL